MRKKGFLLFWLHSCGLIFIKKIKQICKTNNNLFYIMTLFCFRLWTIILIIVKMHIYIYIYIYILMFLLGLGKLMCYRVNADKYLIAH